MKRYALISLSHKTGIEKLAPRLEALGYTIVATSSTAKYLRDYCSKVLEVSKLTGFPEILDGRVKTLHPIIYAGILADRDKAGHEAVLQEQGIDHIDIVIVNLYPFVKTMSDPTSDHAKIIENIDIGGPTLIRAAAKNHRHVCVLTDPADYPALIEQLESSSQPDLAWRQMLAQKAFALVSAYDHAIAEYLDKASSQIDLDMRLELSCSLNYRMRYGENPHQKAALYGANDQFLSILHGKELSYNNLVDTDAALRAIRLFNEPSVVIVKHGNPCGIGSAANLEDAYHKAFATDTDSPFGGIVAVNRPLDLACAQDINQIFTEIIIAPAYEAGVLEFLQKKKDRRLIQYDAALLAKPAAAHQIKALTLGYLVQDWDTVSEDPSTWKVVSTRQPSDREYEALRFAWKTVAVMSSNAIALTSHDRSLGLGLGQTSRIDSTSIAVMKAIKYGHHLQGAVCASDGFFPFRDSIDELHRHEIKAVIQPGGSKGDADVIQACNELGISMIFTGVRHFKH